MAVTREIYVSAVESELHKPRAAVAACLRRLGYRAVWHEYSENDPPDCRALLARKVRRCKGVIQLVGSSYGPEPRLNQQVGGRTSYAQYEALCAREVEGPVWHFILADDFPRDSTEPQPAEAEQLQLTYRRRVQAFAKFCRPVTELDELCKEIDSLKADLFRLRRRTIFRGIGALLSRFGFQRWGLNGHHPDEISRV